MAAVGICRSVATMRSFRVLLASNFTWKGGVLRRVSAALAEIAADLPRRSQRRAVVALIETVSGGSAGHRRIAAAGALADLAVAGVLQPEDVRAVAAILGRVHDEDRIVRAQLLAAVAQSGYVVAH